MFFGCFKNIFYFCITMSSGFKFKRFEARIFMSITVELTALQKE